MVKGLVTGNFRSWGPTQYAQYYRALGKRQKVGIELEVNQSLQEEQEFFLKSFGCKFSWVNADAFELQYLFDVTNPKRFYEEVCRFGTLLKLQQVCTWGSTHVNLQLMMSSDVNINSTGRLIRIDGSVNRLENKCGPVWTNHKELIGGILITSAMKKNVATYLDLILDPKLYTHLDIFNKWVVPT